MTQVAFEPFDQICFRKLVKFFQFLWFWQILKIYQHKQLFHSWMWWSSWFSTFWPIVALATWFCVCFQPLCKLVTFHWVFKLTHDKIIMFCFQCSCFLHGLDKHPSLFNMNNDSSYFSTFWPNLVLETCKFLPNRVILISTHNLWTQETIAFLNVVTKLIFKVLTIVVLDILFCVFPASSWTCYVPVSIWHLKHKSWQHNHKLVQMFMFSSRLGQIPITYLHEQWFELFFNVLTKFDFGNS